MSWLDEVAASCSFCELFNIGKSYGGRDLKVIKVNMENRQYSILVVDCGLNK